MSSSSRSNGPKVILPPSLTPAQIALILRPANRKTLHDNVRRGSFDHVQQLRDATHGRIDPEVLKVSLEALQNSVVPDRQELIRKQPPAVARSRFAMCAMSIVEDQVRNSCEGERSKPHLVQKTGALILEYWKGILGWFRFFFDIGTHHFAFLELDPIVVIKAPVINLVSLMKAYEGSPYDLRSPPGSLELYILVWNCRDSDGTPIIVYKEGFEDGICPLLTVIHRCTESDAIREQLLNKMLSEDLLPLDVIVECIIARVQKVKRMYLEGEMHGYWLVAYLFRLTHVALDFAYNDAVKDALLTARFLQLFVDALWTVVKDSERHRLGPSGWDVLAETLSTLLNWALTSTPFCLPKLVQLVRGNIIDTTLRLLCNLPKDHREFKNNATVFNLMAAYVTYPPLQSALHAPMELLSSATTLVKKASATTRHTATAITNLTEAYHKNVECTQGRWKQVSKRKLCDNMQHLAHPHSSKQLIRTCANCQRKSSETWLRYGYRNYYYSMLEYFACKSRSLFLSLPSSGTSFMIPIFDASVTPYDIKTISVADYKARGALYGFRKQRLHSFIDEYEQRSGKYLVGGVFFYGADKVHILARVTYTPEPPSPKSVLETDDIVDASPFQVVGALIHYEYIREEDSRGGRYDLYSWSLNQNVSALSYGSYGYPSNGGEVSRAVRR
ncbi:hypothetical protein D9611_001603 [Ephemerocybe angulata]|uniref:Uncharacterized protein n=1 Tax=Ephemerocybe angulata TaxID=980116 RepID=A0A8H5FMM9_9AGAR|nr:hypothetical protein D9611_001603 [Tulosesus angulatus]